MATLCATLTGCQALRPLINPTPKLTKKDGWTVLKNLGNRRDITQDEFEQLVQVGDAGYQMAMKNIAWRYKVGCGVEMDTKKAIKWYGKLFGAGDESGAYFIGLIYKNGENVPKNYAKAYKWFSKIEGNHLGRLQAYAYISSMYMTGDEFLPLDNLLAKEWMEKAKHIADTEPGPMKGVFQYWIGCYFLEDGCFPPDSKEALIWLSRSAKNGHAPAFVKAAAIL